MSTVIWELPAEGSIGLGEIVQAEDGEIDHATSAVNRLVLQFRKPKIKALVRALCAQMQPLERAFIDLLIARNIDTAEGDLLEMFARLVGQPVRDYEQETLRRYIRARVRANRSRMIGSDILKICRLVIDDVDARFQLDNHGRAACTLYIRDIVVDFALALVLAEFLRRAVGTGIRIVLVWMGYVEAEMFQFAPFSGVPTGKGFASFADPTDGGHFASAAI